MSSLKMIVLILLVPFLLWGCISGYPICKSDFWKQDRKLKIGVCIDQSSSFIPSVFRLKENRIRTDDDFITQHSEFMAYLQNYEINRFAETRGIIVEKLRKQGFNAKEVKLFLKPSLINKADLDYSSLIKKENIDILILISVANIGIYNEYDAKNEKIVQSYAICQAYGMIGKARHGKLRVNFTFGLPKNLYALDMNFNDSLVPLDSHLNQFSNYPKVTDALNKAMDNAREYLFNSFFQSAPEDLK